MNATKMIPLTLLMLTTALAACAASPEEDESAEAQSDALQVGAGGTVKSISDLEGEGYTCRNWGGTTVTECTKFGSPTYTCDSAGRCAVLKTTTPTKPWPPIVVAPKPGVLAPE